VALEPIGWRSAALALGISFLRGGNSVALKFALLSFAPFWTAFGRMAIALATVGAWAAARRIPLRPAPEEWGGLLRLAALFAVQIGFFHLGVDYTSPAYATVLMNANPIFANVIAHFVVPEDRLSGSRVAGLAIAFSAICAVFLGRPDQRLAPSPLLGNGIILLASLLLGARTVYTQRLVQRMTPTKTVFWQMLLALPYFAAMGWLVEGGAREPVSWKPVLAMAYQGAVVAAVGFLLWVHLLRKHSPGALTVFSFTIPIFGVLLSAALHGETVTWRLVLGVAAVLAGVTLASRARPRIPRPEADPET